MRPLIILAACGLLVSMSACGGDDTNYSGGQGTENNDTNNDGNNQGNNDPGNNDPGNNDPGNNDPGNNDPGNNDPGNNDVPDAGVPDADEEDGGTVPDSDTIGGGCNSDRDCSLGELCVGANPQFGIEGYCTILDCETSADCDFPQGGDFCCSNFGDFRGCFRERDGAVCGEEEGQQNDPCVEGGQSDCDGQDGLYCVAFYGDESAICMDSCDPNNDQCPSDTYCYQTQPGFGICVPHGDDPAYEDCREDPFACDQDLICVQNVQDDPHRYCASLCSRDSQCGDDEWCQIYPQQQTGVCSPLGDIEDGETCTEDRFGCGEDLFCLNEGTRYARCTSTCRRDRDCDEEAGFFCQIYDEANSLGLCALPGDRGNGEPCGDDPFACAPRAVCIGGYNNTFNPDAYCAEDCTDDPGLCGEGFYCQDFGMVSYCQPDGPQDNGDPCDGPLDCAEENFCLQGEDDERFCAGVCNRDEECNEGEYCTGDLETEGVCYPFGDIEGGQSCDGEALGCEAGAFCGGPEPVCIPDCTDDPNSCPSGMTCLEDNGFGQRYCYPFGDDEVFESCEGPYDCEPGSYCSGTGPDRQCLPGCATDIDCPNDYWCYRSRTWSQCLPDGENTTGMSCADNSFDCAEDHLCLYEGTEDAFCVEDCTGFADACGDGEVCRYFGFGLNLCYPIGEREVGTGCSDDAQSCNEESICVGVGRQNAFCAQLCTFDTDVCPEGTECVFSQGGLGTCIPGDFDPGDPIDGGGPL